MSASLQSYKVVFRSDDEFAVHIFVAERPEDALSMARCFYRDHSDDLDFVPYETGFSPVNDISVLDEAGHDVISWYDEELLLRFAAADLLAALTLARTALNTAPRFKVPALQSDSRRGSGNLDTNAKWNFCLNSA